MRERMRKRGMRRLAPLLSCFFFNPDQNQKKKKKKQVQKLKHADPIRASTAALSLFVARLLAGEVGGGGGGNGASGASGEGDGDGEGVGASAAASSAATAEAASRLARRHLGVAEQLAAEKKVAKAAAAKAKAVEEEEEEEGPPSSAAAAEADDRDDDDAPSSSPSTPSTSALAAAVRSLVASTLAHPRSKELYGSFPVTSRGWRRLPKVYGENGGAGAAAGAGAADGAAAPSSPSLSPPLPPALVAIDCEMVETEGGRKTDLARVAVAASIPLCWFEGDEEEKEGGEGEEEEAKKDDENENGGDGGGEEGEKKEANGDALPPTSPPKQPLLSPLEAAALSLKKAGYGPPHLVLSCAVAPARRVSDWRSHVTGLTRCSLSAAPMGRSEAQQAVAAAVARASGWSEEDKGRESLAPEPEEAPRRLAAVSDLRLPRAMPAPAVLVGHAFTTTCRLLGSAPPRGHLVIDTALLYGYEGLPRATPGLADLYSAVVGGGGAGGGKKNPSLDGAGDDDEQELLRRRRPAAGPRGAARLRRRRSGGPGPGRGGPRGPHRRRKRSKNADRRTKGSRSRRRRARSSAASSAGCSSTDSSPLLPLPLLCGFDAAAAVTALFETMPAGVARPVSSRPWRPLQQQPRRRKEDGGAATAKDDETRRSPAATKAWAIFASPGGGGRRLRRSAPAHPGLALFRFCGHRFPGEAAAAREDPATAVAPAAAETGRAQLSLSPLLLFRRRCLRKSSGSARRRRTPG